MRGNTGNAFLQRGINLKLASYFCPAHTRTFIDSVEAFPQICEKAELEDSRKLNHIIQILKQ